MNDKTGQFLFSAKTIKVVKMIDSSFSIHHQIRYNIIRSIIDGKLYFWRLK